jgi:glycosyltransferase involved in cell wall biosynthesis
MKLRILQISLKPPLPAIDGGCIAINAITQGLLKAGHYVKVFTIATAKHPFLPEKLDHNYKKSTNIEAVFIDTSIRPWDAFVNLFTNKPYNVERFYSTEFKNKLIQILKEETFDMVLLESIFVAPYISAIRENTQAKIVLRAHNAEYQIWERLASSASNFLKGTYQGLLAKRLKKYEKEVFSKIDGIAAITSEDASLIRSMHPTVPILKLPLGIDTTYYPLPKTPKTSPTVFHLGAMNWEPNIEAMEWFLEKVWPIVLEKLPNAQFFMGGRNQPAKFLIGNFPNVTILQDIPSANDFFTEHDILVIPVISGGGMRVKLVEGMVMGKAIVTTKIGAEGVDGENGVHFLIADDPIDFSKAIVTLLTSPNLCNQLGINARIKAIELFENTNLTQKLTSFFVSLK